MTNNLLNRDALEAAKIEYANVIGIKKVNAVGIQISNITSEAIEAAIVMYLIKDERTGDIL